MTGTELATYDGGQVEQYRARIVMAPEDAKALDDQLRACTLAVLRVDTDYGTIPGTGDRKVLFRPGAEKLLQWFGFAFTCDRTEIDYDSDGRKEGVTYRAAVTRQMPDGRIVVIATCEGYAGYDEDKFYQTAEEAQFKAEAKERHFAAIDKRPANPNKWKYLTGHRAPWNTIIKMAQKRAIVGATIDATAAAGLFTQDGPDEPGEMTRDTPATVRDEDPWPLGASPARDTAAPWYDGAIKEAGAFKTEAAGQKLWRDAVGAAKDGLCTPDQRQHVQNLITLRIAERRTETAARILKPLDEGNPWREKILDELAADQDARAALEEIKQLAADQQMDSDRAELLGRAIIARYPKAAITEPAPED